MARSEGKSGLMRTRWGVGLIRLVSDGGGRGSGSERR